MSINPDNITTIRVDQLSDLGITLTDLFPHTTGTDLTQSPISDLVTLVASAIESGIGVGYFPLSVTDGQQLPDLPENPCFFLAGAGTYLNINGFTDLICTAELNAIMSVTDHWEIAVEIPITAPVGVQSVTGSAVDNTDPQNPVVNITGVQSVTGLNVDNTDPQNPVVGVDSLQDVLDENGFATNGDNEINIDLNSGVFDWTTSNGATFDASLRASQDTDALLAGQNNITGKSAEIKVDVDGNFNINQSNEGATATTLIDIEEPVANTSWTTPAMPSGNYKYASEVKVISSNKTAVNNEQYTVVANATFTDPSPEEGKGYVVFVRNGTATVGAVAYSTAGTLLYRIYHSGSWVTKAITNVASDFISQTITNGVTDKAPSEDVVYDALASKQDKTTATTGSVISFAVPQIYNSIASPSSSNITDDLTGAQIGIVQKIYSNKSTEPTYPAGWVKRGSGVYVPSTLNIIYAEWSTGTTVEYWIVQ